MTETIRGRGRIDPTIKFPKGAFGVRPSDIARFVPPCGPTNDHLSNSTHNKLARTIESPWREGADLWSRRIHVFRGMSIVGLTDQVMVMTNLQAPRRSSSPV